MCTHVSKCKNNKINEKKNIALTCKFKMTAGKFTKSLSAFKEIFLFLHAFPYKRREKQLAAFFVTLFLSKIIFLTTIVF
jgi:hypothetical protein